MQTFTGLQYLKIDIANAFGLDKEPWASRIQWVDDHMDELEFEHAEADEPMLFLKGVKALRKSQGLEPTGHAMFLDATASGLQIMAALTGCHETARRVNMINDGIRHDVYTEVAGEMNQQLLAQECVDRTIMKKPIMTHYYNKSKQDTLTEHQQEVFYRVLRKSFTGAEACKDLLNQYWDVNAFEHKWSLPDGHKVIVKVTEMINARIEVDELNHTTFMYRMESNQPSERNTSLVPNVIHSIDAYIAREMVRRAYDTGFRLAHIHDAFCAHPNNMNLVRQFYIDIMAEIADSNLLQDIVTELAGSTQVVTKLSDNLSQHIRASEYMLS